MISSQLTLKSMKNIGHGTLSRLMTTTQSRSYPLLATRAFSAAAMPNKSALVSNQMEADTDKKQQKREFEKGSARDRAYYWIDPEAEALIAKAYARHRQLAVTEAVSNSLPMDLDGKNSEISEEARQFLKAFPPSRGLSVKELEAVGKPEHFVEQGLTDKVAFQIVKMLERLMHLFFREKYDHHAVTLETVAAVPGIVGAMHRHLRSLRTMRRDHGWINPLQEEAENERMHLLIWMQHTKPDYVERSFVMLAQAIYVAFYSTLYAISPKTAHRATGYLEEAAHRAYTDYLEAIDEGKIPNVPAMKIAKKYYCLPDDAMLRDVVLHVRADECMHRDYNHHLANLHLEKKEDENPVKMKA